MKGNIFDSTCEALVNPVNCVGVMGAGLAKQFKERYPRNFELYANYCKHGLLLPGECYATTQNEGRVIINFATKHHWRGESQLSNVRAGLLFMRSNYQEYVKSFAIPALGCGLGGLRWERVEPIIHEVMKGLVYEVYEPQ